MATSSSGLYARIGLRALVVEDDPDLGAIYADLLQSAGYKVTDAATLEEATHHIVSRPAVIVLDRNLPDGDGFDFARAVRASGGEMLIVCVSADERPIARRDALAAGCDVFLSKSKARFLLLDTITTSLARRSAAVTARLAAG